MAKKRSCVHFHAGLVNLLPPFLSEWRIPSSSAVFVPQKRFHSSGSSVWGLQMVKILGSSILQPFFVLNQRKSCWFKIIERGKHEHHENSYCQGSRCRGGRWGLAKVWQGSVPEVSWVQASSCFAGGLWECIGLLCTDRVGRDRHSKCLRFWCAPWLVLAWLVYWCLPCGVLPGVLPRARVLGRSGCRGSSPPRCPLYL